MSLIYFVMAVYFDHILAHNRGTSLPFYFPLQPSFWCRSCSKKHLKKKIVLGTKNSTVITGGTNKIRNTTLNTASEEKRMIKLLEKDNTPCSGVRIVGLSKTFKNYGILCRNSKDGDV